MSSSEPHAACFGLTCLVGLGLTTFLAIGQGGTAATTTATETPLPNATRRDIEGLPQTATGAASGKATPDWLVLLPAMHKARASEPLPDGLDEMALSLARGECEGAQVALRPGVRLESIAVQAAPEAVDVALYRVGFVDVRVPSNGEGRVGRWPDPLIPGRDPMSGAPVPAFVQPARDDEPTLVYVEVCADQGAQPGPGRLSLAIDARISAGVSARHELSIPIAIRHFALPPTSTLATSFGFSGLSAARGHGLREDDDSALTQLTRRYAMAALRHRISLHGLSMSPPTLLSRDPLRLDFTAHDAELGALLEGTAMDSGARATSFDVRSHPALRGQKRLERDYFRLYAAHLRAKGWLDRAFFYVADEPTEADLPAVAQRARLVRAAAPGLRVLVTHGLTPVLDGAIDIWTPNMNCLFTRPDDDYCAATLAADAYRAQRQRGKQLWWYQSCGSHGCAADGELSEGERHYFSGWPSYMIDHDAALNRAMGALSFAHGIDGELYFNTVEAYLAPKSGGVADPWRDTLRFTGNGDGTLFYPGTPARLGTAAHLPIESLRLKHLRDGLEDFEYLHLARQRGREDAANAFVELIAALPWTIERAPERWDQARQSLAQAIESAPDPMSAPKPDAHRAPPR